MKLIYNSFDKTKIDEEIAKIKCVENVDVRIDPKSKELMFLLGVLFASGKKISVLNKKEIEIPQNTDSSKSFYIMSHVWELFSDENFPNIDYSNVNTSLEKMVEVIKRLGFRVKPISNNPVENKIFLICPVRNATDEQRKEIESFVAQKVSDGQIVHAPHLHTVQHDLLGGYTICKQNAVALATSFEIDIYYDKTSVGSVFDLGIAYYLGKPLKLLNRDDIVFDENDFSDYIINNWPNRRDKESMLIKR